MQHDAVALLKKHGKSFNFARLFLGKDTGIAAARLYGFCRIIDDIADENPDKALAKQQLDALRRAILHNQTDHALAGDFLMLCEQYGIDRTHGVTLIDGVSEDLDHKPLQSEQDLISYAYKVAGVVGLMMAPILGAAPQGHAFAIDLGIAMQLTNIARDVTEDANMGRRYIPSDWVQGLSASQISNLNPNDRPIVQHAIIKLLKLAETYYQSGLAGLYYLPATNKRAIAVAAYVYRQIGREILNKDCPYWQGRLFIPTRQKARLAAQALRHLYTKPFAKRAVSHHSELHAHLVDLGYVTQSVNNSPNHAFDHQTDTDNTNVNDDVDVLIIGAGAAGLSLLLALNARHYSGSVRVVERQESIKSDRIWSFWYDKALPGHIDRLIVHRWHNWQISTPQPYMMTHPTYQYCSVRSEQLGSLAFDVARQRDNMDISFDCEVVSITPHSDSFKVATRDETITAKYVIDTRPPPLDHDHQGLLQCFYGEEIVVDADLFDPSTAGLMERLRRSDLGIEFVYILPFSPTHALIEFTCFSLNVIDKDTLQARFKQVIQDIIKDHDHTLVRTEHAVLPMYPINQNKDKPWHHLIYGGIAGGAMRASTGYSFLNSQRWAKRCAQALIQSSLGARLPAPISPLYRAMDTIMLHVIRQDMDQGVVIFERLFERVDAKRFARFMTEQATPMDILSVITAMPKRTFLTATATLLANRVTLKNTASKTHSASLHESVS